MSGDSSVTERDLEEAMELIKANYLPEYHAVSYGKVVEELRRQEKNVFEIFSVMYDERWIARESCLVVLQVEAAQGHLDKDQILKLLSMMEEMGRDDSDHYTKTLYAVMGSNESIPVLMDFLTEKLSKCKDRERSTWLWNVFLVAAHILVGSHYSDFKFPAELIRVLEIEVPKEESEERKSYYEEDLRQMRERIA